MGAPLPISHNTRVTSDEHEWIVDSLGDLIAEVENIEKYIYTQYPDPVILFRGQRDTRWALDSKFVRSCKRILFGSEADEPINPRIKDFIEYHQVFFGLLLFKHRLHYPSGELERLGKLKGIDPLYELHRRIQQYPEEDKLVNLKGSPLVDWTKSMDVALYFMNEERIGDGAVFVCNATATGKTKLDQYELLLDKMIEANNEGRAFGCPLLIFPPVQIKDERVNRQEAVYWAQMDMRFPIDEIWAKQEKDSGIDFIYRKLVLKDGTQSEVDEYLIGKGITHSYLFP